jgi:hypothetical protein
VAGSEHQQFPGGQATVRGFSSACPFRTVTLPDVDSTVLAAFGLGQGAYLGKKLAGAAGG